MDPARNIDVYFDSNMNMKNRTYTDIKDRYHQMRSIAKIRKYLSSDAAGKFTHSFVTWIV